MRFFVWKVIYQGSLIFMIISRISFRMPFQIQPHSFSLVSTVKLQIASTYLCHLYISYHRYINKIISLEHRIKVYKTNCVKTGRTNWIFTWSTRKVPINKAANNIAIICKKCYVTIILKEIGILDAGNERY